MMDEYRYLAHYGIKDMKWGVRRFQDYAGRLTEAGRDRYGVGLERAKSVAKIGSALGRAKGSLYKAQLSNTSRKLSNQIRRKVRGKSIQIESLRRQRDYYERKSRGRQFIRMMTEKKDEASRRALRLSDTRFRARINVGRTYIQRMSAWEDMVANPRGRDLADLRAMPTRFDAAKSMASMDWYVKR